jgi:hypothetical protein
VVNSSAPDLYTNESYAVCVGLNLYTKPLRDLDGADTDAQQFKKWLNQAGLVDGQLSLLVSSQFRHEGVLKSPSRDDIERLIHDTILEKEETRGGKRLYLYFSGHGVSKEGQWRGAAICSARARPNDRSEVLDVKGIAEFFLTTGWFQEVILIFDACRVKGDYTAGFPEGWNAYTELVNQRHDPKKAQFLFALACPFGGESFEKWIDGRVRGVFTYYFLRSINEAPRDDQNRVTATSAVNYLKAVLSAYYRDDDRGPRFDQEGDLILKTHAAAIAEPQCDAYFWVGPLTGRTHLFTKPASKGGTWLCPGHWGFQLEDLDHHEKTTIAIPAEKGRVCGEHDCFGPLQIRPGTRYEVTLRFRLPGEAKWNVIRTNQFASPRPDYFDEILGKKSPKSGPLPTSACLAGLDSEPYNIECRAGGRIVHVPV